VYDNGSEFKLNFKYLCDSYGIKRKPTTIRNPQANAILEHVHQVLGQMLRTAETDMADSVTPDDVDVFRDNAAWAIRSTYHTVLEVSPGAAIFGRDMLFDIPFIADWNKTGDYRQHQTDLNSLTSIDAHERQHFNELCGTVVSRRIFIHSQSLIACLKQLNCYKGPGGNEKLPPRRIPTVGIVRKVSSTRTQLSHKHHHHGGAVCPSYGVVTLDAPDPTQVTSSEGVG